MTLNGTSLAYGLGANLNVAGTLTVNSSATLSTGTYGLTVGGSLTGTGTVTAGNGIVNASGDLSVSSFTSSSSTTTVGGNFSPTTFGPNGGPWYSLRLEPRP